MRTLHSFATICVFSASLAALVTACGSSDNPTPGGSAGSPGAAGSSATAGSSSSAGSTSTAGDATKGAVVWNAQACNSCHAEHGEGQYGPNITFSTTAGIGGWTLAQFSAAVRDGKRIDGSMLCLQMTRFPASMINDTQMADLYAYVKSLTVNDTVQKGTFCPTP